MRGNGHYLEAEVERLSRTEAELRAQLEMAQERERAHMRQVPYSAPCLARSSDIMHEVPFTISGPESPLPIVCVEDFTSKIPLRTRQWAFRATDCEGNLMHDIRASCKAWGGVKHLAHVSPFPLLCHLQLSPGRCFCP